MLADISGFDHVNMIFVYSPASGELLSTQFRGGDAEDAANAGEALRRFMPTQNDAANGREKVASDSIWQGIGNRQACEDRLRASDVHVDRYEPLNGAVLNIWIWAIAVKRCSLLPTARS